jgi:type IX secretion system PorP/SprF family membrane protein
MKNIIYIILVFVCVNSSAQQIVMHSNYMINGLAINPAVAGTKTYAPLVLGFRRQWTGIREAPVAEHLSYHTYVTEQIGIGAYAFNDVAGPARRSGVVMGGSVQIKSSYKTRMSFGLAGSLSQYMIDRDKLVTEEPDDVTVMNYTTNQFVPDLSSGIHIYSHNYHIGLSVIHLLQTKTDLFDIMTPVTSTLDRTFYLNAAYKIESSSAVSLEIAGILRYMTNAPLQLDLSGRIFFNNQFYIGSSFRYKDALALLIGFEGPVLGIGYAYDLGLSSLNGYHSGSHEVVLTFKTNQSKNTGTGQRNYGNRVYDCPSFK